MNHIIAGLILLLCAVRVQAAGFQTIEIPGPGIKPISLAIWYPSLAPFQARNMGAFSQDVASNGAIEGEGLPLVVISHGNGGYKYSHLDTALDLANAGFVVVALTHPGDNYADQSQATDILERPKHVVLALDFMLQNWQQRDHIAPNRVGIFGFSSGGFTALVNIGGTPDMAKVFSHCAAHPTQYACTLVDRDGIGSDQAPKTASDSMHDRRIRAAVIAAPALGFTFDAAALKKVGIPIQLWRAEDDMIVPHPWYAEQVRVSLPREPDYHVVAQAGHFDFLAPCSEKLSALAPQICASDKAFDRSAFHRHFNTSVIAHFTKYL